jgi:tRNA pseudouridine55 synthase
MKDGILAVSKPAGISSARVVARIKKVLGVKKIGHTGTLDPFATGLLLIAVGKATRISRFFLDGTKTYTAQVTLGIETDTYDSTGQITFEADPRVLKRILPRQIKDVVGEFSGRQKQVAPSFSALKHNGQPLYKLARRGEMIQKPPRDIEIFNISVQNMDLPRFEMMVHCSGGTYIRSLAYDIGKKLSCGAHLSGLCRNKSGSFELENALGLKELEESDPKAVESRIISMSDCLSFLPCVLADQVLEKKIKYGQRPSNDEIESKFSSDIPMAEYIRVQDSSNNLLALIEFDKDHERYNYCCVFSG